MRSKKILNASHTSRFKAIGMQEYNWGLGNPNKKTLKGFEFDIHAQVIGGGHGV
jgi:hypothetical protein